MGHRFSSSKCLVEAVLIDELFEGLLVESNTEVRWDHAADLEEAALHLLKLVQHRQNYFLL